MEQIDHIESSLAEKNERYEQKMQEQSQNDKTGILRQQMTNLK